MGNEKFEVIVRRYFGNSIYCGASTPGYSYLVAIPVGPVRLPAEAVADLFENAPKGETYFVFETASMSSGPRIASSAPIGVSDIYWYRCALEVTKRGLRFVEE